MREVDTSETSVVWPAWCYSGETTVNEDLPQRLVAAAAAVAAATTTVAPSTQKERRRRRRRRQQPPQPQSAHQQRASSNQSNRRSSSSASVSSPSPPSSVFVGRGKRKSITRTTPLGGSPVGGGALEAASSLELGGSTTTSLLPPAHHGDGRCSPAAASLQLLTGCRGGRRRSSDSDGGKAVGRTAEENECYRFGAIDSRVLRQHRAALHSLDKMLSERIYDRKKYLNSPTGGGGGGGVSGTAGSPTGTHGGDRTGFYEKYHHRNGSSGDAVIELSLIKNGTVPGGGGGGGGSSINGVGGSSAHLSAIAASIISGSNGSSSSGNGGGIPGDVAPAAAAVNSNGAGAGGSLGNTNQITSNKPSGNNNNNSSASNNNIGSGQCINQHSNSSSIKSERFSPPNTDAHSMASRSRSATPSSFSGTPPQTMHPGGGGGSGGSDGFPGASGLLPSPNSLSTVGRPEFQARNYSDFMRSLAAKYNNNNNSNDVSQNMKNSFLEPKMRFPQPKSFIEGSLSGGGKKSSPLTSTQVPNPSIMTSLFSGLPFQSAVFPPLIDMSSTQALVTLARAAKESDIHHILKTDTGGGLNRKPVSLSRSSSPSAGAHHHFPFTATGGYLPGLLPSHHHHHHHGLAASFPSQPVVVPPSASASLKSPSRAPEPTLATTFPLDLSASTPTPPSKRIKLSPSNRHREASPAPSSTNSQPSDSLLDLKPTLSRKCHARIEEIAAWTVDHVCDFVASIDICAEYVQNFRDQSIDGAGLPLLTEEHLTNSLGMKLGPALKLRSMLAKKLGGPCPCTLCAVPTPPTRTNSSGSGSSKGDTTPTNRPPSNGSIG
ncbi:uncharacterized protein LOC131207693 [Anopheles bellator]|uniref:uncharacterized protein LOC131207693 n=1 Tax=Anopheles bellator TaxID=139047 RepID=UPI002649C123|nr:uncharacterized protein LOC131207693 [Anopheles bellator]